MRYLYAGLAGFMFLFALVQYDDPDGPLWMVLYGVPAIWAGIAAMRPRLLAGTVALVLLGASLLVWLALVVVWWPPEDAWWRMEVWWESEDSREGMGLMIAAAVIAAVLAKGLLERSKAAVPQAGRKTST